MILFELLLAMPLPAQQPVEFQVLLQASPGEPLEFVHIEAESPLVLGLYSSKRQVATWPPDSSQFETVKLAPQEHLYLDKSSRLLGVLDLKFACIKGALTLGKVDFTKVRFPKGLPKPILPKPIPVPEPNPPPPVAGACALQLSEDGSVAVLATTQLELDQPSRLTVFRRDPSRDFQFVQTASLVNRSQGKVSLSRDGRLLAVREGRELRVLDHEGNERARLVSKPMYLMSAAGDWLVQWSSKGAAFHALDGLGATTGEIVEVPTSSPCIDVQVQGGLALIRERATVRLLEIAAAQVLWSRTTSEGHYCSMDLVEPSQDRVLVALGIRKTLRSPSRRDQVHVSGLALGLVEVLDTENDALLAASTTQLDRWTYDTPRVEFVTGPTRVLVTTPDVALLSLPIP